ncbi:hypothetical protein FNW02_32895 [Komarekiella sp. 'clone 1']|uniref:Uncharacterized protein n=1 Tax=Komarekiella delphini-convector SJRDD-AB1 TaxID=2593771 RepID=A0AA40T3W3_9NOST|nr:hypothetical protein [Komarekiella delphini-convector]MBD6620453.1 hypothetical protein [Komarekiella delphini-convector SJRDD-AB1]
MSFGHKGEAQGFAPLGSDTDHRRTPALRLLSAYRTFRCGKPLRVYVFPSPVRKSYKYISYDAATMLVTDRPCRDVAWASCVEPAFQCGKIYTNRRTGRNSTLTYIPEPPVL